MRWMRVVMMGLLVLSLSACENMNKQDVGVLAGGAVGALLGNQIGGGSGKILATVGGAVLGAYLGGKIGASMDKVDRMEVNKALEKTPTNQAYSWHNPDTNIDYRVQPTRTYAEGKRPCRTFVTTALIDGKAEKITGKACRRTDGTWQMEDK